MKKPIYKDGNYSLIERRLDFIRDTIEYYSANPKRRNIGKNTGCMYAPVKHNTEGCAIGRHLNVDLCRKLDNIHPSKISNPVVFKKVPKWMRELEMMFLRHVQVLHDNHSYWDKNGLSKQGKECVDILIDDIIEGGYIGHRS